MPNSRNGYSNSFELRLMIDLAQELRYFPEKFRPAIQNIKSRLGELREMIDRNSSTLTDDILRFCDHISSQAEHDSSGQFSRLNTLRQYIDRISKRIDTDEYELKELEQVGEFLIKTLEINHRALLKTDKGLSAEAQKLIINIQDWFSEINPR